MKCDAGKSSNFHNWKLVNSLEFRHAFFVLKFQVCEKWKSLKIYLWKLEKSEIGIIFKHEFLRGTLAAQTAQTL